MNGQRHRGGRNARDPGRQRPADAVWPVHRRIRTYAYRLQRDPRAVVSPQRSGASVSNWRGSSPLLVIARWQPGLDRGVWHRDMSVAVGRDGRGIGFARDQCGVCGADRTNVSAGSGQWKTLARVRDRRGWGGLSGALTLPKGWIHA